MYIHAFQAQHQYQRTSFLCSYKDTCHTHTTLTSYWSNQTKKIDKVRFLGVIIDGKLVYKIPYRRARALPSARVSKGILHTNGKLTWDDHINYLESKLLSCIVTIKRKLENLFQNSTISNSTTQYFYLISSME